MLYQISVARRNEREEHGTIWGYSLRETEEAIEDVTKLTPC